jgi:transposase InsO family protein
LIRLESDNGPPFNSIDFANFAIEEGFEHHEITPLHPRANGEAEAFMKVLNKMEQIANLQNKDSATAIQEMLIGYRSTLHPATGISPYEALMKRFMMFETFFYGKVCKIYGIERWSIITF